LVPKPGSHKNTYRNTRVTMNNDEDKQELNVSEFRNAKLPTFWKDEPKLWFTMLEREFAAYGVRNDAVKCAAVIRHLDSATTKTVADIIEARRHQIPTVS